MQDCIAFKKLVKLVGGANIKHLHLSSIIDPEEDEMESSKFCNFFLFLIEII